VFKLKHGHLYTDYWTLLMASMGLTIVSTVIHSHT